jgi:pimeloyl-ACP methyl ester carboxylesterase
MPRVATNGVRLAYERTGRGDSVVLIMGSSASGRVWTIHQTPALMRASYETVTFDNRGVPPSDAPPGRYSLDDMVADAKGLVDALGLAPCRFVGSSLGSMIIQELAVRYPQTVRSAVLLATRARADVARKALSAAQRELAESGVRAPAIYRAAMSVMQMLSPASLDDDAAVASWLEVFELSGDEDTARGQSWVDITDDRREQLRKVTAPCRVVAFADDLIAPPHLGAEVAQAIPDCDFITIPRAGHLGYLERPDEVNEAIVEFFAKN